MMANVQLLSRRQLLILLAGAGLTYLHDENMSASENLVPATTAVDHILFGVSDLDRGIRWVEEKTGVRAAIGGSHPGVGTRNALISLGAKRYLEIIAPDPAQDTYKSFVDVRSLTEPRVITWAAQSSDVAVLAKKLRERQLKAWGPNDGSRKRPDGKVLKWSTVGLEKDQPMLIDPLPFFIQWASDTTHPSDDSPKGCELQQFGIEHPNPTKLKEMFDKLGLRADITSGKEIRLKAILKTPKGIVEVA